METYRGRFFSVCLLRRCRELYPVFLWPSVRNLPCVSYPDVVATLSRQGLLRRGFQNHKGLLLSKRRKCGEIAKGNFSKITETARWEPPRKMAYSEHSIFSMAGYVTAIMAIVRAELRALEESSLWFRKMTSCNFTLYYSFMTQSNVCFLRCTW